MEGQSLHFLQSLETRLMRSSCGTKQKKSRLRSYFAGHHEFQEPYREPSSSPEVPDSSSLPSSALRLYPEKRRLPIVNNHFNATITEPAKKRIMTGDLRRPAPKRRSRLSTEQVTQNSMYARIH
jgi:hypothetical protein